MISIFTFRTYILKFKNSYNPQLFYEKPNLVTQIGQLRLETTTRRGKMVTSHEFTKVPIEVITSICF